MQSMIWLVVTGLLHQPPGSVPPPSFHIMTPAVRTDAQPQRHALPQPLGPLRAPAFHIVTPIIAGLSPKTTARRAPPPPRVGPVLATRSVAADPLRLESRPREDPPAIEYSDFYALRATIHRDASYAMLPLFVAEYAIGRSLYNRSPDNPSESLRSAHGALAAGIAGLFGLNTATGLWNLWDARKDPAGRTRRYLHAALMLASTAGFVATGALAPDDDEFELGGGVDQNRRSQHRSVAIASMSTALAGYLLMLIWRD